MGEAWLHEIEHGVGPLDHSPAYRPRSRRRDM
jgi:hypothetical protein